MQTHIPHIHLPHPHIDLRRLGRDAMIAAELGLAATLITASASRVDRQTGTTATVAAPPPATTSVYASSTPISPLSISVEPVRNGDAQFVVRGVVPAGASHVSLYDEVSRGLQYSAALTDGLRIDGVAAGRYYLVVMSEGPTIRRDDVATSSAVAVRSPSITLETAGSITVRLAG